MDDSGYKIIFVDHGSTDDSLPVLRQYNGIKILQEENRGYYVARNRGIREARGDFIAFTDSDCFPVPGWSSAIKTHFDSRPQPIAVLGPRIPHIECRSLKLISAYENQKSALAFSSDNPQVYFGYANNTTVRRNAMNRTNLFVERGRGSDTIYIRRLVDKEGCQAVAYCSGMAVQHAELESIGNYYSKIMTYTRSRKSYRRVETVRPLSRKERIAVFRETMLRSSALDSIFLFLFLLLTGGAFAWWWGGLGVRQSDV